METSRDGPKRLRATHSESLELPSPCFILRLPAELLMVIAEWTAHPGDILPFAYTCRYLYQLFAHKDSESAWRYARNHMMLITSLDITDLNSDSTKNSFLAKSINARWMNSPIPPPLPGQTEIYMAQALFDKKICPTCKKEHKDISLIGIILGISFCRRCWFNAHCHPALIPIQEAEDMFQSYEYQSLTEDFERLAHSVRVIPIPFPTYFSGPSLYLNREAWRSVLNRYIEIRRSESTSEQDSFIEMCSARAEYSKQTTQVVIGEMNSWISRYEAHTRYQNEGFVGSAQAFAQFYKIRPRALRMVPKFQHLCEQSFTRPMFDFGVVAGPYLDRIIAESHIINENLIAKDLRRAQGNQLKALRRCFRCYPFPKEFTLTFQTFISFSIIKSLRNSHSSDVIAYEPYNALGRYYSDRTVFPVYFGALLNRPQYKKLLDDEMNTWRKQTTVGARRLLGYSKDGKPHTQGTNKTKKKKREKGGVIPEGSMDPDSKQSTRNPASRQQSSEGVRQTRTWDLPSEKLDPELRATAWFTCNICQSLEPRYRRRGVFDFLGMCAHQCQRPDCSKKNPLPWAITNFTPALHAIETTRAMLKILGLDEEDPGTTIKCFDGLWLCKSCPDMMKAMEWEDLIHHCSRHSTQRLEKISMGDTVDRKRARAEGKRRFTVSHLLSNKKEGEKKRLLCVHCMSSSEAQLRAKLQVPGQIGQISAFKVMDIHGIRQHLKVKHKINHIRNEDIYFMDGSSDELVKRMSLETGNGHTTGALSSSTVDLPLMSKIEST